MRRWAVLLLCSLLFGCASVPEPPPLPAESPLFADAAFAPPSQHISADEVFALSPAMQRFLDSEPLSPLRQPDPRRHLLDLLYRKGKLVLEYDAAATRNAAQAFDARAGNCLSLVIMTATFAKAMGLPVAYQSVFVDEAWSRSGDLYFASGHVNLSLSWTPMTATVTRNTESSLVVDFLPPDALRGQRSRVIPERTVVAMFMNNRAAEAMARGAVDDAYWWAREAMRQDSSFLVAYNTLGVVYLRHGQPQQAQALFETVLRREPENTKVMGNLVRAYEQQGQTDAAQRLAARLAQIEPHPPFFWFNAGLAAMREHDYRSARELFNKELGREAYYHEFHFWLAQAEAGLGNLKEARKHLELALQGSTTAHDHDIYAAKLDRLRAAYGVQ